MDEPLQTKLATTEGHSIGSQPAPLAPQQSTSVSTVLLPQDRKYCQTCATVLDVRAEICPRCGIRQNGVGAAAPAAPAIQQHVIVTNQVAAAQTSTPPAPSKSNVLAFILGLFFGPVGLWYKGHWAAGFVWLVLTIGAAAAAAPTVVLFWLGQAIHAAAAKPI